MQALHNRALSSHSACTSSRCTGYSRPIRSSPQNLGARNVTANVSSFDPQPPPPPPPPPPPSMPPQRTTRRDVLMSYAGVFGAGTVGTIAGYLIGSQGSSDSSISGSERKDIDSLRAEAQFKREYDGHVWVRARSGDWWEARLDAQVPGTVLLRNPQGYVYFLNLNIQQIDLTDDYVMAAVFGDGSWEANVQRVQARDDASGEPVDLQMPMDAFRDMISLMS